MCVCARLLLTKEGQGGAGKRRERKRGKGREGREGKERIVAIRVRLWRRRGGGFVSDA